MSSFRGLLIVAGAVNLLLGGDGWANAPLDHSTDVLKGPAASSDLYGDPLPPQALRRLGTVRLRPPGRVYSLAFSPDGNVLVSAENTGDRTGTIRFWDVKTGREARHSPTGFHEFSLMTFSPAGDILVGCPGRGPVTLWEAGTGRPIRKIPGWFEAFAFSPDAKMLALVDVGIVGFWEVATGKELRRLEAPRERFLNVAFSPNGKQLAAADGRSVYLWDIASGHQLFRLEAPAGSGATTVGFSRDGHTLAGGDLKINLWDTKTGKLEHSLKSAGPRFAFSPDGRLMFSGGTAAPIQIWQVANGKRVDQFPVGGSCLALSPDGRTLASAGAGAIRLWNVASGEELLPLRGHHSSVHSLTYSLDGKIIASGGSDGSVRVWDAATGEQLRQLEVPWQGERTPPDYGGCIVGSIAFAPDGKLLACQSSRGLFVWEVGSGRVVFRRKESNQSGLWRLAFSPDGRTLASCGLNVSRIPNESVIRLWDVARGLELRKLRNDKGKDWRHRYLCVAFSADGRLLAAGGDDGNIDFWDPVTGEVCRQITVKGNGVGCITFSPDGKKLAWSPGSTRRTSRDQEALGLWDLEAGRPARLLKGRNGLTFPTRQVAFSPDGKVLAAGEDGGKRIQLWEVATGAEVLALDRDEGGVLCVAFSPDGKSLASGGADTTVLVWDALPSSSSGERQNSGNLAPEDLARLWDDLGGRDAVTAYRAQGALARGGSGTVAFLKDRLGWAPPAQWPLQRSRAIQILERDRSVAARKALESLSRGDSLKPVTAEAQDALSRLERRRAKGGVTAAAFLQKDILPRPVPFRLRGHFQAITAVAFSPDGKTLATADLAGQIGLWSVASGKSLLSVSGPESGVYALAWSVDGKLLAGGGGDHLVRLWDPATGQMVGQLEGHRDKVSAVAFSPDGRTLASGSYDGTVRIWAPAYHRQLWASPVQEERVTAVAFSPDGKTLATGCTAISKGNSPRVGQAGPVRLWDAATARLLREFPARGSVVTFTADGWYMAAGGRLAEALDGRHGARAEVDVLGFNRISFIDLATGQDFCLLRSQGGVFAFSPDGRALVTAAGPVLHYPLPPVPLADDQLFPRVLVSEVVTGRQIYDLAVPLAAVVTFSPNCGTLAVGTAGGPVIVWNRLLEGGEGNLPSPRQLSGDMDQLWADLGGDSRVAYPALWRLVSSDGSAVAFLRDRLEQDDRKVSKNVARWITDLDTDDFATREQASRKLRELGMVAEPALRHAWPDSTPEARKRLEALLINLRESVPSPEILRRIRAIQVLEYIGSDDAQQLLAKLGAGLPLMRPSQDAQAALARLKRRPSAP